MEAAQGARRVGMALAATSALLFAAKAVVAKVTYRYGVPVETVVVLRLGLAMPLFAALVWRERRRAGPMAWADRARVAALGLGGLYGSTYLDFAGLAHVSASLERLVLFLNPTFVLLLAAVVLRRPPTRRQWAAVAVAYAGVAFVFAHDAALGGGDVWLGGALVLGSALVYAVYLTVSGEIVRRIGTLRLTAGVAVWAALAAIAHAAVSGARAGTLTLDAMLPATVAGPVMALSLVNAFACYVAPMVMLGMAIARVGAPVAASTGLVGPVATIALAAVVLGEPVTLWSVGGAVLVLAGVGILARERPA